MQINSDTRPEIGAEVVGWRESQLQAAGFVGPTAGLLALDGRFDLHRLIELARAGCPPHLAARIAAPLDACGSLSG